MRFTSCQIIYYMLLSRNSELLGKIPNLNHEPQAKIKMKPLSQKIQFCYYDIMTINVHMLAEI